MWYWLLEAITAFIASNVDELLVSVMQFAQAVRDSKPIQVGDQASDANPPSPTERTPLQLDERRYGEALHVRHVVLGQFIGFTLIIALSLAGYALGTLVDRPWIGLLGLLPIVLGVRELTGECRKLHRNRAMDNQADEQHRSPRRPYAPNLALPPTSLPSSASWGTLCCSTRTLQVASVAFASGSDSIGQSPFASCTA